MKGCQIISTKWRTLFLALIIFVSGNSVVRADDIHVISDVIYNCYWSLRRDCKIDEYQVGDAYISRLSLNEARNLTPPINELAVSFETNESSSSLYGYLEAVSPSGLRIAPDELTRSSFPIDCNGDKSIGHNCTISITKKGRDYYTCSYPGNCNQSLFFYYLKFPLGSESGPWNLELSVYWSEYETVGTVTQMVKKSKKITFPNALIIAATDAPTTTTTSTQPITTTTTTPLEIMPKVTLSKSTSAISIAKYAKLVVLSTSKVSLKVASSHAKYCKVSGTALSFSGTALKGLRAGSCKVTVTVRPKKGNPTSKTVTLTVTN